jgi:hypothetical protein
MIIVSCSTNQKVNELSRKNDYKDLLEVFIELRKLQDPVLNNGVPDYTPKAMANQKKSLEILLTNMQMIDTTGWSIHDRVDFHLVLAEMKALEFHHRIYRPWARDPGFYSFRSGDAGASMNVESFIRPLFDSEASLTNDQKNKTIKFLKIVPEIFQQARVNLIDGCSDFADLAIRNGEGEARMFENFAGKFNNIHPDLASDLKLVASEIRLFGKWLYENKHTMTSPAGVGKENYSWWMKNVQLSPWGWEESSEIIQREYDRIITFLKLEEHRNRDLPALKVSMTRKEYEKSIHNALHHVVDFLDDGKLMTIDDWVNPADYTGFENLSELEEHFSNSKNSNEEFSPENTSIDTKVRQREIVPGESHEYIGHMLDYQRQERLNLSPIRKAERRFNMGSMRLEGWAVALEELLMQVGVLDDRPRKGREMEYLMNASHMSLAIPDMKLHANEINLAESRKLCAEIMPRGWSREDEDMVWFEMQSNIRNPGGFHSNVVTGKAYFMKLFRERAVQLGDDFVIKDFIDEFLSFGIIPMPLIRWEMTGNDDEIKMLIK